MKKKSNIKYILWAGNITLIVMVIAIGLISLTQLHSFTESNEWVGHTNKVLIEARDIKKLMLDMETGQRGFIITGEEDFLEPFSVAHDAIFLEISELQEKVKDNPAQVVRLVSIERMVHLWLKTAGYPEIEARRLFDRNEMSFSEVADLLRAKTGKKQIDTLRHILEEFITLEETLTKKREATVVSSAYAAQWLLILGVIIVVITILVIGIFSSNIVLQQDWLKSKQAHILSAVQGIASIREFADILLSHLSSAVSVQISALYIVDDDELQVAGSYGAGGFKNISVSEPAREKKNIVSQCLTNEEIMRITDIPDSYYDICTSLGKARPKEILLWPILFEGTVIAVLELASFSPIKKIEATLLHSIENNLGIVISNLLSTLKTKNLAQTLRISEARNRAIIDNSVDGIITINSKGIVQSFSPSAEKIFGYDADEVIGNNIKRLMAAPYHSEHDGYLQHFHNTGEKRVIGMGREVEAQRKDGTIFPIRLSVSEVTLEGSTIFVGTVTDVTEEKSAREIIEQQTKEAISARWKAEEASRTKSEFLANMSHELRTPLNSLLILARELMDNGEKNLTAEQVEDAGVIYESGNDLLMLINDILDLAKVESGKMNVLVEEVLIKNISENVRMKFHHMAEDKGLELVINIDSAVPEIIQSDTLRIEQILRNFLSNSFKFTHEGSITLDITIPDTSAKFYNDALQPETMIAFAITDTGIGIAPYKQKDVFEAFHQADSSTTRKYGGTGLGLSISRELAGLLGGEIHLESKEGEGSTFTLYIQKTLNTKSHRSKDIFHTYMTLDKNEHVALLQEKDLHTIPDNPLKDDRSNISGDDITILVVDDDKNFAKIIRDKIRSKGHKALVAIDGVQGLQLIFHYQPDAIILDIDLPEINGIDIYERVRQSAEIKDLPIFFMSVQDEKPILSDDNAVGFLSKPVSPEQLEQAFSSIEAMAIIPIKHLLIVEDNESLRCSVSKVVKKHNIKISEAANGVEALEILKSKMPDCILLDLMMPQMDGITFLEKIVEDKTLSLPRVIVYSAKDITQEEAKIIERYSDLFIRKGGEPLDTMIDKIFTVLRNTKKVNRIDETKQYNVIENSKNSVSSSLQTPANNNVLNKVSYDFSGRKILIVDDEPRNIIALSRILQSCGLKIHTANNGQEALEILEEDSEISCVLMDMMMPVMNGYEAMEEIRKHTKWKELPIIAVTAKAMQEDRDRCMESGATMYVPKPIDKSILLSSLSELLIKKVA